MKRDRAILFIAGVFGLLIVLIAVSQWLYLARGYSLAVGIQGGQPKIYHIDFPPLRRVVHVLLWSAAFIAAYLLAVGHKSARLAGWSTFVVGLGVGIWDTILYGSIGSPTSALGLLLLLALALTTQFRNRLSSMV